MVCPFSASVSPVSVSFSLATAPRSPACSSVTGLSVLPWGVETCARRSGALLLILTRLASFLTAPVITRKKVMRPANGSAVVLKTKAEGPVTPAGASRKVGGGKSSTMRSRIRSVPTLWSELAASTGKMRSSLIPCLSPSTICSTGSVPSEHIVDGLKQGIKELRIFPVLAASSLHNVGTDLILDLIVEDFPPPTFRETQAGG